MSNNKLIFMLVADNDDRFLTATTLQELGFDVPIRFFSNSNDLFGELRTRTPSVIVVDYNIVPETGLEILKELKSLERYRSIPIIILTDSPLQHHHTQCYLHGASTVIKKPDSSDLTARKISTFFDYWMNVAETA